MTEFFSRLLDTSDFPVRWNCGNWTVGLGWLHIVCDLAIFSAYAAIPLVLVFFVRRRQDMPFLPLFWLFAAFILACGTGHLVEATLFWQPWYRLSGLVKLVTAIASWVTVIALVPVLPHALALPSLARVNDELKKEIQERELVQQQLLEARAGLEQRIQERTKDLSQANARLQEQMVELEKFSKLMVGREERMIELKFQVNHYAKLHGEDPPYDLSFSQN